MPSLHQKYQTYNSYDYQSQPAITDFSPRAPNKKGTQNKIQQVRDKINDVISLANDDKRQGKNEFQGVVQGQRGILDLLKQGADTDPALSHLYLPSAEGKYSRYVGPAGQGGQGAHGGNYPFDVGYGNTRSNYNIESSQHPLGSAGPTGYPGGGYNRQEGLGDYGPSGGQNAANSRMQYDFQNIPMSQQARQQLADIQIKATQYLQELKRVRGSLVQELNQEIKAHNRDKQRRMWLEQQLSRIINQLKLQGKIPPHINFPEWYQQTDSKLIPLYTPQTGNVTWNHPIPQDYPSSQPLQQRPIPQAQYNQQNGWVNQPNYGQNGAFSPQKQRYSNNYQQQFYQNQQERYRPNINNDGYYGQNHPQQTSQYYQQSYHQIPYLQQNQQPSYHQSINQSYQQQRSPNNHQDFQNLPSPGQKYYDNRQTSDIYAQPPRVPSYQQQQQGMKNRMQDLRRQNQYIRNYGESDSSNLKQRLDAAERMANDYAREMDRWRMEGKKGANYPGLLQLLDQGEKIRQQTLKLLKLKK